MSDDRGSQSRRARDESEPTEARGASTAEPAVQPTAPLTQQIGRVIVGAAAVLFLIFAFVNIQPVTFNWVFGQATAIETGEGVVGGVPLIVLLLVAFLLGMVVGAGLLWRTHRARRAAPPASPRRLGRRA